MASSTTPTTSASGSRDQRRGGRLLEVRVHPDDLGRVIGRGGRTAASLRTVVDALAGQRVRVDFVDSTGGALTPRLP